MDQRTFEWRDSGFRIEALEVAPGHYLVHAEAEDGTVVTEQVIHTLPRAARLCTGTRAQRIRERFTRRGWENRLDTSELSIRPGGPAL